jgi:hypothetical protein
MKKKGIRRIALVAIWPLLISLAVISPGLAAARSVQSIPPTRPEIVDEQAAIWKILEVLESRVEDPKLVEIAKKKLLTLDRRKTHLLSSLCDRIENDGHAAGSDVAFLVMTILIVLS